MAKVRVSIVHNETGQIISVGRPSKGVNATVLSGDGQSVFEIEVEEDSIGELVDGSHRVDVAQKSIVGY